MNEEPNSDGNHRDGKRLPPVVQIGVPTQLLVNARRLRKDQTNAEEFLWELLKNRQLNGLKFRRQHPIKGVGAILDFFCPKSRVAIELDGAGHLEKEQRIYDEQRTRLLTEYGIRVLRFRNKEIVENVEGALNIILKACT